MARDGSLRLPGTSSASTGARESGLTLRVEGVTVRFDDTRPRQRLGLDVAEGEIVTVLGPSGSGKSTPPRVIAGLQRLRAGPSSTAVVFVNVPLHRRGAGLIFQDHALFPQRDVGGTSRSG